MENHIKQIQKKAAVQATLDRINQYLAEVRKSNSLPECFDADCVWEGDEASAEEITMEDLWPKKSEIDVKANVQDPLQEIHLGTAEYPRPTYVNALLTGQTFPVT